MNIKLNTVKSKSLVKAVIDEVIKQIRFGNLKPGDQLPSERELISQLNVGRSSVREALKALELLNLIEIKPGKGAFIRNLSFSSLLNPAGIVFGVNRRDLFDLIHARKIIETEAIKIAVLNASEEDIKDFEEILKEMKSKLKNGKGDDYIISDFDFHKKILECANNRVLMSIFNVIYPMILDSIATTIKVSEAGTRAIKTHTKILEKIKKKDSEGAVSLVLEHLEDVRNTLNEFFNKEDDIKKTPEDF